MKIWFQKKKYLRRNALKIARHKKRRMKRLKALKPGNVRRRQETRRRSRRAGKYIWIEPPKNFSLIENTEELLNYFEQNRRLLKKCHSVNFNLSNVENLTFDALAYLMTKIKSEEYTNKCNTKWKGPKKPGLGRLFKDSWFLDHVRSQGEGSPKWERNGKMFKHFNEKRVDNETSREASEAIIRHVFWSDAKYPFLHPIFIECMSNTNNHAWDGYKWWLFYYREPETHIAKICFIDLWMGIFGSFNSKLEKFAELLPLLSTPNKDKLLQIVEGRLRIPTRTKEAKRWKGLASMARFSQRKEVKNFTIISNDVYWNLDTNDYRTIAMKLDWTVIYWELHPKSP